MGKGTGNGIGLTAREMFFGFVTNDTEHVRLYRYMSRVKERSDASGECRKSCIIRVPGGSEVAEKIRTFLETTDNLAPLVSEALLIAAIEQVEHDVVVPAITAGAIILCEYDAGLYLHEGRPKRMFFLDRGEQFDGPNVEQARRYRKECKENAFWTRIAINPAIAVHIADEDAVSKIMDVM